MDTGNSLQLFSCDSVSQSFLHLILGHMDQQVADTEDRIRWIHSDIDFCLFSVPGIDDTYKGQGNAGPLVFLDAPVVVGAEINYAVLFIDRICF